MPISTEGISHKKHLICFFDINDTMYIGDSAKNVTKEMAIFKLLAENYSAVWDPCVTDNSMTYRDFVDNHLCPGDKRAAAIQEARQVHYNNFIKFLQAKNHPLAEEIARQFDLIQENLKGGNIPESFISFIKHLEAKGYPFTIVFRTFGKDIHDVAEELSRRTSLKKLNHASFSYGTLRVGADSVLETPEAMLRQIQPFQHAAWQDSFADWRATGESYAGGKPYPIDCDNDDLITVFFDDNVSKQILHVRVKGAEDLQQDELQQKLIRLGRLVSVSTFDVCVKESYFIDRVEQVYHSDIKLRQALFNHSEAASRDPEKSLTSTPDYAFYFNCLAGILAVAGTAMFIACVFVVSPPLITTGVGLVVSGATLAIFGLFCGKKSGGLNEVLEQPIEALPLS